MNSTNTPAIAALRPTHARSDAPGRPTSLVRRLSGIIAVVLLAVLVVYAWVLSSNSIRMMTGQARDNFAAQTASLRDLLAQFDDTLREEADRFLHVFASHVPGPYSVDPHTTVAVAGQDAPAMYSGYVLLNNDFDIPDHYTEVTAGTVATVFARTGDDFIRVTTSLKKSDGSRAVGTLLDRAHPSYAALMAGQSYLGLAQLFGSPYMSKYEPVRDAAGSIVGALFVGVGISREMEILKSRVRDKHVNPDDTFFIIDAATGAAQGTLLASTWREGENIINDTDASGAAWVRDMIAAGSGTLTHAIALGGTEKTEQLTAFTTYPAWNWLIASSMPMATLHGPMEAKRNLFIGLGALLALLLALGCWQLLRRMVSRPLAEAAGAAARIAQGDLGTRLQTRRRDEIGAIIHAIDGIGTGLSGIVRTVRGNAEAIAGSTSEIARGNADLSNRTSIQAGSLEATVASLEELSVTVQNNTENARNANASVHEAVSAARESGTTISRVVDSMSSIRSDATHIENIINIIDGIAFQTNILALNAAVESARAGEHGRGFAVVAGEVRSLAQRSATAAAEIKTLIERTVSNVESGNHAVRQAGISIDGLVARVEDIAAVMDGINTASTEQAEGISQVRAAAIEMDHFTQENAALVEEAAAAAAHLDQQARELQDIVARFRLPRD